MEHTVRLKYAAAISLGVIGALPLAVSSASAMTAEPLSIITTDTNPDGQADSVARRGVTATSGPVLGDPVLCPVDELEVPEGSSVGVVTEWLDYGESLNISATDHRIWAGVWFTPWNGPGGWVNTPARADYPLPGAPSYGLVARFGNGPYEYIGEADRTYTNNTEGVAKRVRLKVNDNVPGNGDGWFNVMVGYTCH